MQNLSQPFPKPAHALDTKEQENQQTTIPNEEEKAVCIIGGESEALGFHQETTKASRTQQNWFCIKLYIILYQTSFILAVWF